MANSSDPLLVHRPLLLSRPRSLSRRHLLLLPICRPEAQWRRWPTNATRHAQFSAAERPEYGRRRSSANEYQAGLMGSVVVGVGRVNANGR